MITQNANAFDTRKETTIMQSAKQATRASWRYAAFGGAALCSGLALAYTIAFIIYALARSALTVVATVNQDAGMWSTLIATWSSLIVAALVIGTLLAIAVAMLGAMTGIAIKAVSIICNQPHNSHVAAIIGASVCFAIVILLHLVLRSAMNYSLPDLFSMHALFWLELPSLIFVVAGSVATHQLN